MMVISGTYLKGQKASELVWPQIALLAFTTPQQFLEYVWPNIVASKNGLAERMLFFYRRRSDDLAENSDSLDELAVKSHWSKKMKISTLCFFSTKNRLFPVSVLHWDAKGRRYRLKSGSGTFMVSGETKDVIVAEASAHFNLQKQILVFQDGTEAPEDFNLPTYTRNKGIKYPYKAKVS